MPRKKCGLRGNTRAPKDAKVELWANGSGSESLAGAFYQIPYFLGPPRAGFPVEFLGEKPGRVEFGTVRVGFGTNPTDGATLSEFATDLVVAPSVCCVAGYWKGGVQTLLTFKM